MALIWCCLCGPGLDDFQNSEPNQLLLFISYQTHGILTMENIVKSRINAAIPYTKNAQWPSVCHLVSYMYAEFQLLCLRHREYDPWFPAHSHSSSDKNKRPCHELGKKKSLNFRLECALVRKEPTAYRKTRVSRGTATQQMIRISVLFEQLRSYNISGTEEKVFIMQGTVLHFKNLKVQASLAANTFPTTVDRKASPHPNPGRRGQSD